MIRSGPIALIGSGEFEPSADAFDLDLLTRASGDGSVLIVPTASALEGDVFNDWAVKGLEHYRRLAVPARVVSLMERTDAFHQDLIRELSTVSLIYISGGNPEFLAETLSGSPFWNAVMQAVGRGAALAGCSAGACILGEFAPRSVTEPVERTSWGQGLRVLPNVWILPHWDAIRPEVREHFLAGIPPDGFVLGIDEQTAMVGDGHMFDVYGKGAVTVLHEGIERGFFHGNRFELQAAHEMHQQMDPDIVRVIDELPEGYGPIGLLSSDEFTPAAEAFDRAMLERSGPRVAVLLCADPETAPAQSRRARSHYEALGAEPIILDVLERSDAEAHVLPDYDLLFVGGGSPSTLVEALRGTTLWHEVLRRWQNGAGLAGSSAGAMAMCRYLTLPEPGADAPTRWTDGIGLLSRFALAVHAASRPPEWLQRITREAPVPVVAMDDACGLILRPGAPPRFVGGGSAWVVDPEVG